MIRDRLIPISRREKLCAGGRRSISAEVALRLGRYFGNGARIWLDLQGQYDIALVEHDRGAEIARTVRPADAAE